MTHNQNIANTRRNLLIFAERSTVKKACETFGVSRTTFYKIKEQFLKTGSLEPKIRRKPKMPNETSISKKKILLNIIKEHPSWGSPRYSNEFRKKGIDISQVAIWYCLKRFGLNRRYQRMIYLEELKNNQQPLTERTLHIVKRKFAKINQGLWPGHIVALDTFFVGHIKGIGRIYQMSGIDLCSRYGWAHLYTSKEQVSSIDFLERCLIPKFFHNQIDLETVLMDNGTEFTGYKFKQMLIDYDIKHIHIDKGKPVQNGYCERFQRTIHEEFYQPIFRKKFFKSIEALQYELDQYLVYYNFERAHFGLSPKGEIPINIFKSKETILRTRFKKLLT
ncbi:MAG: DDE-type integrase/transposase/recombinase [Candidatus Omnitrophica bacterium]|nr:DDE-type integrase/transposase/recombinase [Candidatus Omnitrophota bacterium]MBU1996227.1 DDE-type integrase/transposase/recombinase [Candidatus Omnitrophota bacterium]MBU4334617.1 DDE-type integrase/transposase/recombinase [Candidatus Omnitrophota bacterium]